jgi:methylenetetrahydrofolate reductase (NADPH)
MSWKVYFVSKQYESPLSIEQEEAFSIWSEWASFYRPGSEEREVLEGVRDNRWLVNIVHHDYKDSGALWTFLLDERAAS